MRTMTLKELEGMPPGTIYREDDTDHELMLKGETWDEGGFTQTELCPIADNAGVPNFPWPPTWRPPDDEGETTMVYVFERADLECLLAIVNGAIEVSA